jgi:hypothetical protein
MVAVLALLLMVLCILVVLVVQVEEEHQEIQTHLVDLQHNQVHMVGELIMEIEEETILYQVVDGHQQEEGVQVVMEQTLNLAQFQVVGMEESVYN